MNASPIARHPDNPHYFIYKGKPLVLITTDHHYGAVINLDFDYVLFLDRLHQYGMNLTRIYPGCWNERIPSVHNRHRQGPDGSSAEVCQEDRFGVNGFRQSDI